MSGLNTINILKKDRGFVTMFLRSLLRLSWHHTHTYILYISIYTSKGALKTRSSCEYNQLIFLQGTFQGPTKRKMSPAAL